MGSVWRATATDGSATLAVKVLRPQLVGERSHSRFIREAQYAAAIQHPNVIDVYEHGFDQGRPYLTMELLNGQSLDQRLEELPPPTLRELVQWMGEALEGLAAVHRWGVIHRDLKPANLFLAQTGEGPRVKVLDFGLSRSLDHQFEGSPVPSLTQTHQFLGTPYYVSPEQIRSAKHIDARADLFSLGVIFYEAVAGRRPFDGPNATAVIAAVVADEPVPLGDLRPDVPRELIAIIDRALARSPEDRFASCEEMAAALTALPAGLDALRATPRDVNLLKTPIEPEAPTLPAGAITSGADRTHSPRRRGSPVLAALGLFGTIGLVGVAAALAAVLIMSREEGTAAETSPMEPVAIAPAAAEAHYQLTTVASEARTAHRWLRVPPDARASVVAGETEGGWALFSRRPIDAPTAEDLADALGALPVPATLPSKFCPLAEVRTTAALSLRAGASADESLLRVMPRGTLAVALLPEPDSSPEGFFGAPGHWTRLAPAPESIGHAAANFLRIREGCWPRRDRLGEPPEHALVGEVELFRQGQRRPAYFVVVAAEHRSDLTLFQRRGEGCEVSPLDEHPFPGRLLSLRFARTSRRGDTLLIASWQGPRAEVETWAAYLVGGSDSVWELSTRGRGRPDRVRVNARQRLDTGEAGYWPLVFRYPNRDHTHFRWDGRTLVQN